MDEQVIEVYYPTWVQLLTVVTLPAMTLVSLWLISRPVWETGLLVSQYVMSLVLGTATLYQCVIGWRGLRFIRARITLFPEGLEVVLPDRRSRHSWEELAPPKEYSFATMTRFRLRSGKTLLYAFSNMQNLTLLKSYASASISGVAP